MANYFEMFKLPYRYEVDKDVLEVKYLELQSQFHPDKARNGTERLEFVKRSANINEAHNILASDVHRAEYLLGLKDIRVNKESNNTYKIPQKLLMEQMELREKVLEADKQVLDSMYIDLKQEFKTVKDEFSDLYKSEEYEGASTLAVKLRFMSKLLEDIKKLKKAN